MVSWTSSLSIGVFQDRGATVDGSATDLLRCCSTRGAQQLLQSVMCLSGGVPNSTSVSCDGVGYLSTDVTSGVCAVILSYIVSNQVRSYGSVSGPLLEEVMDADRRLIDLSELTEGMMWDDIGIVSGEEYRLQLYANHGYSVSGERASSPEIGN